MSSKTLFARGPGAARRAGALVLGLAAWLVVAAAGTARAADAAIRVVGTQGSVVAHAPDGTMRVLRAGATVAAGEEIVTARDAAAGLLVGSHYVGLDQGTTAVVAVTDRGAPDLQVRTGRARVLDSGDGAPPRVSTPGLAVADAGTDTDVFAFPEKGGLVSMVCPAEGAVVASRGGETLRAAAGACAVAKRGEPLYTARAGHAPLAVLGDTGQWMLAVNPVARLGAPLPPVALGLGAAPLLGSEVHGLVDDPRLPCDDPARCSGALGAAPPAGAPTNPPIPGDPCQLFPQLCSGGLE